jgi:TPR repeat protein
MTLPPCHRLLLAVVFCALVGTAAAQPSVTRRTVQSPAPRGYNLPSNSVPIKSVAPVTPGMLVDPKAARPTTIVIIPQEKPITKAEKAKRDRKTFEFHYTQAEAGRDFAQYEMGLRYLKGDGVAQDLAEARRWFTLAAEQNYTLAIRKLAELDAAAKKKESVPVPVPDKEP